MSHIIRILIFASLAAGTLGFFWPKEIRPWDLADQTEKAARRAAHLEELCEKDHPYCFRKYSGGRGRWPCGRNCERPETRTKISKEDLVGFWSFWKKKTFG